MGTPPVPTALLPTFVCGIDDPIVLFEGEGILSRPGKTMRGECTIAYSWSPNQGPELTFKGSEFIHGYDWNLEVQPLGLRTAIATRQIQNGSGGFLLRGQLKGRTELGSNQMVRRVAFHVGNFPSVLGEWIAWGSHHSASRMRFLDGPWEVLIDPIQDLTTYGDEGLQQRLSNAQGFSITHIGSLRRVDGTDFQVEEAEPVLTDVSRTLSFARGAFSCPFLRIGYNDRDEKVWQSWSGYRTDAWSGNGTWFSTHYPGILNEVFQGWRRLAADPNHEVINAASHLFIDAHAPTIATETRLVIAQAALEGLADGWPHPIPSGASIPSSIDSRTAAYKIAKIPLSLGLTLDTPIELADLRALPNPTPAATAPEKITWIRNSIAHLQNFGRIAGVPVMAKYDAFQLSAHYLELALLRLLDVKAAYLNRLKRGSVSEVDPLPWM